MMKYQCSWSIYVPHLSKTTALKKERKKKKKRSDNRRDGSSKTQLGNWETNSRTTEIQTKKPPTFSRLRLEGKRDLSFPVCVDKPRNRSWGWAGLPWCRVPGKGRCPKSTITHLLDPLWNKPAPGNEPNQKLWFLPCRDWNLGTETVRNSLSADSKKGGYFPIQIQMLGATWENHFYILHSA